MVAVGPAQGDVLTNTRVVPTDDASTRTAGAALTRIRDYIEGDRTVAGVATDDGTMLRPVTMVADNAAVEAISVSAQNVVLSCTMTTANDFPWVGAVVQSYLKRTLGDCRDLAVAGSRVRLCKGAYKEPASVAYQDKADVDLSYVRCLKVLMAGEGHPMVASHDPRLIEIAQALAAHHERTPETYEFQMLYGIRPDEQKRIADRGAQMRVYIPFGDEWYGYLMRRMAERPANTMFFMRSLITKG